MTRWLRVAVTAVLPLPFSALFATAPPGIELVAIGYVPFLDRVHFLDITTNLSTKQGRQANRGMEGLAISADGSTLYGIMLPTDAICTT